MDYPHDFPGHLKRPVDAAIHAAEIVFIDAKQAIAPHRFQYEAERLILRYVESVFFAFAAQAIQAGKEGVWNGERIRQVLPQFLDDLGHHTYFEKHPDPGAYRGVEHFKTTLKKESKDWKQWRAIHEGLKEVAEMRHAALLLTETASPFLVPPSNQQRIEEFMLKVLRVTGVTIKKQDLSAVAGYTDRTQFQRFQRNDLRTSKSTKVSLERVLRMSAEEFLAALERRKH